MRFSTMERQISEPLHKLHLDSIRNKLMGFAVLATLIPSLFTALISYSQNKRALNDKLNEELGSVSSETAREMDLWIKERFYDLRVFASSYVVSENLAGARAPGLRRVTDYLNSVRGKFPDYEELLVIDPDGRVLASTGTAAGTLNLPSNWQRQLQTNNETLGAAYWDATLGKALLVAAVPIQLANGRSVGAIAAKLNLLTVDTTLRRLSRSGGRIFLTTEDGDVVISSDTSSAALMKERFPPSTLHDLTLRESSAATSSYTSVDHEPVIGMLKSVPRLRWAVLAELPSAEAYRQIRLLRNWTVLLLAALLVAVGSLAYLLGLLIVRPLARLAKGAAAVAQGDFAVDLPVMSGGEVGELTAIFNDMVARLRAGRQELDAINETLRQKNEELERLSSTDALTGLYNRRHLMDTLTHEVTRSQRLKHNCSVLMVDVDHFKGYNDTFGHLAGDEVLKRVADLLRANAREVDFVARYGGEEFLVVLPETAAEAAMAVAERVRASMAAEGPATGPVTLSVGVADFPDSGDTPEALIAAADAALYEAKRAGRNRVERARKSAMPPPPAPAKISKRRA